MARKTEKAPEGETKEQAFKRIGARRTRVVLKALDTLIKTANPTSYRWSEAEANAIMDAVAGKVKSLHERLSNPIVGSTDEDPFVL